MKRESRHERKPEENGSTLIRGRIKTEEKSTEKKGAVLFPGFAQGAFG